MKNPEPVVPVKKPRHVAIATNHLVIQLDKAIAVRDKAAAEVKELDAALLALGWQDQLNLL
jgi:hypothetical protein